MTRLRRLAAPLLADLRPRGDGWASRSLGDALRRAALLTSVGWHGVMALAAAVDLGPAAWMLVSGYALAAGYAAVAVRTRLAVWPIPLAAGTLGYSGYVLSGDIDSLLTFASCWEINFATCVAGLLLLSRRVLPLTVAAAAVGSAVILLVLPHWGVATAVSVFVTQLSIIAGFRLGLPGLLELARRIDDRDARAAAAAERSHVLRRRSEQAAEEARALHDTAVNTLAAIATGGAALSGEEQVRLQCARDVRVLTTLREEHRVDARPRLSELFSAPGLPIDRAGLDDAVLDRLGDGMPERVVVAVIGCVREAVTNATKHSGAAVVAIDATADDRALSIRVVDTGHGFVVTPVEGRGIAESILARAEEVGIRAQVLSRPGAGTVVDLDVPLDLVDEPELEGTFREADAGVDALRRRAGRLWGLGVTAVSAVLTLAGGSNHDLALLPMMALMLLAWGVVSVSARGGTGDTRLPWWTMTVVTLAAPAVFVLAAAANRFGTDGALHWQALAVTGPLILLLSHGAGAAMVAGAVLAFTAALGIAVTVAGTSLVGAGIVAVAAAVGAGFVAVWAGFQAGLARLGERAALAARRELAARAASGARTAAQVTFRRWIEAGLDEAVDLLGAIASGAASIDDPLVRERCAREETYLRQLLQVSPELVHLGPALLSLHRDARVRDIWLGLRLGDQDAASERGAEAIAQVVSAALRATPPGEGLIASVFPAAGGLRLTLVGSAVRGSETASSLPVHERGVGHTGGSIDGVLEVTFPAPPDDRTGP